ncbi:hypothetical protein EYC59_05095 [Candidatus Saccharibacteria bacterium]|nr:MAG: hypothetical protein EYC59_05095 [Candidatus Saccharibacteria bacterium]
MVNKHGDRILGALKKIEASGVQIRKARRGNEDIYTFGDDRYEVVVEVDPEKYLGATFGLQKSGGMYPINTDMYPLDDPKHPTFSEEIEDDIVALLDNLREGKFKVSYRNNPNKPLFFIPVEHEYVVIKPGLWKFSSTQRFNRVEDIKDFESFEPFPLLPVPNKQT